MFHYIYFIVCLIFINIVASNADGQMYQKVYVNPEHLDQIGINDKKVNSKSPIIECGIACNLNVSCNGFFFAEDTCRTFQLDFAILHYAGSDKYAIYLEKEMVLPSLITPDKG